MTKAKAGETSSVKRPSGPNRKRYTDDFKRSAVRLVTDEKYSFKAAAKAVQISEKSLRDWHALLGPKPAPCGDDANLQELREENRRLRQQLRRVELEREILKKATAYFAKESL